MIELGEIKEAKSLRPGLTQVGAISLRKTRIKKLTRMSIIKPIGDPKVCILESMIRVFLFEPSFGNRFWRKDLHKVSPTKMLNPLLTLEWSKENPIKVGGFIIHMKVVSD